MDERIKYLQDLKDKATKLSFNEYNTETILNLFNEQYHKEHTYETPYPKYFACLRESCKTYMETLRTDKRRPRKGQEAFDRARNEFADCIQDEIMRLSINNMSNETSETK